MEVNFKKVINGKTIEIVETEERNYFARKHGVLIDGKIKLDLEYDYIRYGFGMFSVKKDGVAYFMDMDFKPYCIERGYDDVFQFTGIWGDIAAFAIVCKNDKKGFVDTNLNEVVPVIYDRANKFVDGFAEVSIGSRHGYVDYKMYMFWDDSIEEDYIKSLWIKYTLFGRPGNFAYIKFIKSVMIGLNNL